MTLDEAIKHAEEAAEKQENNAKNYPRPNMSVKGSGKKYNACIKCAEEHRQLAEWLKELKTYREAWSQFSETLTELKDYNTYDNPDVDDVCKFLVNYKNVLERQIKNKEVNVDDGDSN